jgi:hypothetical protein
MQKTEMSYAKGFTAGLAEGRRQLMDELVEAYGRLCRRQPGGKPCHSDAQTGSKWCVKHQKRAKRKKKAR